MKKIKMKKLLSLLLIFTMCMGVVACGSSNSGVSETDAIVAAKDAVKARLKAPSTAKFCSYSDFDVSHSGDTWTVEGWVDAQNGFGATIRSKFRVVVKMTNSSSYTLISCTIN